MNKIAFIVNGNEESIKVDGDKNLLHLLRDGLRITSVKNGCSNGTCGACMVLINGEAKRSCLIKAKDLKGCEIVTLEGLSSEENLDPIQDAMVKTGAIQCGFCTSGMVLSAKALLNKNPKPTIEEIKKSIGADLCRCTGYLPYIEAIQLASSQITLAEIESKAKRIFLGKRAPGELNIVGKSPPRIEAVKKVTGRAVYTDDIYMEDMLHLATLRSKYPSAKILSVDTTRAENMKGVVMVITARDIPGENLYGKIKRDIPVLASDKVRSYQDAVALVVAEDRDTAYSALDKIKVEYKPLPAVFNPEEALLADAPNVHVSDNLLYHIKIRKGDVDEAFTKCDIVLEKTYQTKHVDHAQMEPEAAIAYFDDSGKLTIKAPCQSVFFDRLNIIRALGVPKEDVRVIQPEVGGAFGKREDVYAQIHTALAAFLTRRSVKAVYTREETFLATQKRHPIKFEVKTGVAKDGKILAHKVRIVADTGAYASWGENVLRKSAVHASGPYEIPNVHVDAYSVYTNNPFCGAMRGFGTIQAAFAYESQMDEIARMLQMDPVAFREKNLLKEGSKTATGQIMSSGTKAVETLLEASRAIGWGNPIKIQKKSDGNLRYGRGIATIWYGIGFGCGIEDKGDCIAEIHDDGSLTIYVGTVDYGQGSNTIFCQMAAEILGLSLDRVKIISADSDITPNCGSTVATRQTYITGNAVVNACKLIARDMRAVAGQIKGTDSERVKLKENCAYDGTKWSIKISQIAQRFVNFGKPMRREGIFGGQRYTTPLDSETGQGDAYYPYAFGTQAAEVEVNIKTGRVRVLRIVAAHYVGRAINPVSVRGQILGGIQMGIGYALTEDCKVIEGMPTALNFDKYKMVRSIDMPEIETLIIESPEATGPFGAIGIGEPPAIPTAPAIANAIRDAIGFRATSLPIKIRITNSATTERKPRSGSYEGTKGVKKGHRRNINDK